MHIEALKTSIENASIKDPFIIFVGNETFLCKQYYKAISQCVNKPLEYIDDLERFKNKQKDIFGAKKSNTLQIAYIEILDIPASFLIHETNLIIICKKVAKNLEEAYNDYIINIPKLEAWHIKDYVYSVMEGVSHTLLDWFITVCNNNIDRIQNEIDKLIGFPVEYRQAVFEDMIEEGAFADISDKTIFDFSNALQKKDLETLKDLYEDIDAMDVEDLGLVTILHKNFLKLLAVWTNKTPTPENTGLSTKQIWAIKNLPKVWTLQQLLEIICFLSNIDFNLKTGLFGNIPLRDYVICKVLTA